MNSKDKKNQIINEFEVLAKKHGKEITLSAARKWLNNIRERKVLLKQKEAAEKRLNEIKEDLGFK